MQSSIAITANLIDFNEIVKNTAGRLKSHLLVWNVESDINVCQTEEIKNLKVDILHKNEGKDSGF